MTTRLIAERALRSGAAATLTSGAALAAASWARTGFSPQALNATSHWLHGDGAARVRRLDLAHTGVGAATHLVATIFWASFFETWNARRPTRGGSVVLGRAIAVSVAAAVVDYTATPHRFTPGWELVLSKRAMAVVYAAMAAGLALPRRRRHGG